MADQNGGPSWGIFVQSDQRSRKSRTTTGCSCSALLGHPGHSHLQSARPFFPFGPVETSRPHRLRRSIWSLDFQAVFTKEPHVLAGVSRLKLSDSDLSHNEAQRALLTSDLLAALASPEAAAGSVTVLRLLFPACAGTPIRSHYIEYRLRDAPTIRKARTFLAPRTSLSGVSLALAQDVRILLRQSLSGVIGDGSSLLSAAQSLDAEFDFRLSVPWITPSLPPPRKRVLWIRGRANILSSEQFYHAAEALGITLVVADAPGHWM